MSTTRRWPNYRANWPGSSAQRPHRHANKRRNQGANAMRIHGRFHHKFCLFVILIAATGVGAFAQGRGAAGATNDFYRFNYNAEEMQPINYPAQPITTQHQITLQGETIQYTAHAGFIPIRQATSGVTEGHLFYIYYSKNGVTDKSKRPVWFLFNGGPGAATVWLHMGAF